MKTPEQWQEELCGETSVQSIQEIQRDALVAAIAIIASETNRKRAVAQITDLMNKESRKA